MQTEAFQSFRCAKLRIKICLYQRFSNCVAKEKKKIEKHWCTNKSFSLSKSRIKICLYQSFSNCLQLAEKG